MNINRGKALKKAHYSGFLTRLAKNQAGNVMPLLGFLVFPMAAMVGGAVDLSRIYMVQTRLQNACDAGAIAARRGMTGASPSNDDKTMGNQYFDANFPAGSFGATSVTRSYGGTDNKVVGTATAVVPATVMQIFGREDFSVEATCTAILAVPNADVMFVLDVSGSMASPAPGDTTSKIAGLKAAAINFYKALGAGSADPNKGPRIRYGFVPYATNVNVGRLLNNSWMADTARYNTRVPTINKVWTYTLGTESGFSAWSGFSPATMPTTFNTQTGFTGWALIGTNATTTITVNGVPYRYRHASANSNGQCSATNTLASSGSTMIARTDVAGTLSGANLQSTTNNPPTYNAAAPPSQQVLTYNRQEPRTVTGYRYRWQSVGGTNGCWLERGNGSYNRTQTATTTRSISWLQMDSVSGWTFGPRTIDVSGLKAGGSNWNSTLSIPNSTSTSVTVRLSGQSLTSTIEVPAPQTFQWRGCIEEAQSDNTITATSPLTIPDAANDMKVDLVPSNASEFWKPHLLDYVWGPNTDDTAYIQHTNTTDTCVPAARGLQRYATEVAFRMYTDTLVADGNTQHDIGMVWGARLLSQDGIFGPANKDSAAPQGYQVSRHLVFMTDGFMNSQTKFYGPWGISRLDGRDVPTTQQDVWNGNNQDMNNKHYRRMEMICNAARQKGFTVWVVGFGMTTLPDQLRNCASGPENAVVATSSAALTAEFQKIAKNIGGLRLTKN
jgi:Flp pilus assembly protein TadG